MQISPFEHNFEPKLVKILSKRTYLHLTITYVYSAHFWSELFG